MGNFFCLIPSQIQDIATLDIVEAKRKTEKPNFDCAIGRSIGWMSDGILKFLWYMNHLPLGLYFMNFYRWKFAAVQI